MKSKPASQRRTLQPEVGIGHVHLKVANQDRAMAFYRNVLGFELTQPRWNQATRIPLEGASDHSVSEALYLRDPDGNGIKLYRDRPREQWPRTADGGLEMFTHPLDLEALIKEAPVFTTSIRPG
jgi:catechol-2,3-dioxygenase